MSADHCQEMLKPGGCQLHNLHCGYPKCNEPPEPAPVRYDIERMEKALASPSITMPTGMTREEIVAFMSGASAATKASAEHTGIAIAQLRHLYKNMTAGGVRDTASAKRIAAGILAPVIEHLERLQ